MHKIVNSQNLIISSILIMLVFLAFEPIRSNDFIDYDDIDYLTENPFVQSGITIPSIKWAFTSGHASNWHPLTWLSHMLDITLFGMNPVWHHLHNVLLHTANTVLLFLLLKNMSGAIWRSAFTAMLFGLHPLRAESVAWAAERKDVLCMFFILLTIATYLYYVRQQGISRYLLVIFCFALSLMAKPMAVTLPLLFLLLDIWPLKRLNASRWKFLIAEKIPLLTLTLISCFITFIVQKSGGSVWAMEDLPFLTRLSNAVISYAAYLGKFFWPLQLAVLYPYPDNPAPLKVAVSCILLIMITFLSIRLSRKYPFLITGWLWYLIALVPVIGLVQVGVQAMADRYTYLPSIGICIMVVWSVASLTEKWKYQKIILSGLGGLLALFMLILMQIQLYYWKDSVTLYKHALAVTNDNYVILYNLGNTLARQEQTEEAKHCFYKALEIEPDSVKTHNDLAVLLIKDKQYDEAIQHFHKALSVNPEDAETHNNLGALFITQQQYALAKEHLVRALKANPNLADAHINLAQALEAQKQYDEALKQWQAAIRLNPDNIEAYNKIAFILTRQSKYNEAVQFLFKAAELSPDNAGVYFNLALLFQIQNKEKAAIAAYSQGLKVQPNNPKGLNGLAWILTTTSGPDLRNPTQAVSLAQTACQLSAGKNPEYLKTLAAAYAAASQFDEAVQTAQTAINSANTLGLKSKAEEITRHLHLYRNHQALKDTDNNTEKDPTVSP